MPTIRRALAPFLFRKQPRPAPPSAAARATLLVLLYLGRLGGRMETTLLMAEPEGRGGAPSSTVWETRGETAREKRFFLPIKFSPCLSSAPFSHLDGGGHSADEQTAWNDG